MNYHDFIGVVLIPVGTAFVGVGAVQTASSQQDVWSSPWFDVGFAMVMLGALLVIFWRRRSRRSPIPDSGVSVQAAGTVVSHESPLVLRPGKGEWRPFGNAVWGFAIPVRVTNLSDDPITLAQYHLKSAPDAAQRPPIAQEAWNSVSNWMAEFSSEHESEQFAGEIIVPPGESIMRWFVSWVNARPSDGGRPAFTLQIKDSLNDTYELYIPDHPTETYPSP
jgi:hypothetical protein